MQKVIENKGTSPMYHGSTMIPPGEMVVVEVPERAAPPAPPPGPSIDEQLAEMLALPIAQIVPQLATLNVEALERLGDLEQAGKHRKGLVDAIAAELLALASAKLEREEAERVAAEPAAPAPAA